MTIGDPKIYGLNDWLTFGKYKGMLISTILISDPGYIVWLNDKMVLKIEPSIVQAAEIESAEMNDDIFDNESFSEFWGDHHA